MGSWAKGVTEARGSDRGDYLPDGTHDCEVLYTDAFEKRNGGGTLCKVRLRVLASNNPDVKAESEQDMCFNVDPSRKDVIELQLADVRGFVMAVEGVSQQEVTEEVMYYIFDQKNKACEGKRLRIVATTLTTKKEQMFTKYKCSPFDAKLHEALKGVKAA